MCKLIHFPFFRSSPSDFSPRGTLNKHDMSRDSTLKNNRSTSGWRVEHSPSPTYPVHHSTLGRSPASPFEVSSSSGSSRSKTPVKTFYLGQDNTYQRDHGGSNSWTKKTKGSSHSLADAFSSSLSVGDTHSLGRSNLSGHYGERSHSFCRVPTRSKGISDESLRYETLTNGAVYSKVNRVKKDQNVQVSMSDDDDDHSTLKRRDYNRERSPSPHRLNGSSRSILTLPRTVKVTHETSKSPYSTNSLSHSKYYKSTDSLHSPGYSSYYSSNDYGTYRNASPIYNNSSFHRDTRNDSSYRSKNGWGSSSAYHHNTDSYNGINNKVHEVKIHKKSSHDVLANGGKSVKSSTHWYPSSSTSLKSRKIPTSPPESGYQSPFPPTPPSSPPPRVIKVLNSDHYGSSSSMSPPDSPVHPSTASIRKRSTFPSGSASRSKSSTDLRTEPLFAPEAFTPLSSPLKLKTMGSQPKKDHQKYFRVKPGHDGQSVVVQVRDWNAR